MFGSNIAFWLREVIWAIIFPSGLKMHCRWCMALAITRLPLLQRLLRFASALHSPCQFRPQMKSSGATASFYPMLNSLVPVPLCFSQLPSLQQEWLAVRLPVVSTEVLKADGTLRYAKKGCQRCSWAPVGMKEALLYRILLWVFKWAYNGAVVWRLQPRFILFHFSPFSFATYWAISMPVFKML